MTKTPAELLTLAVAKAMAAAPVPVRDIARRAGVSHAFLHRIAQGQVRCSERVGARVAKALEAIAAEAEAAARILRRSHERGAR